MDPDERYTLAQVKLPAASGYTKCHPQHRIIIIRNNHNNIVYSLQSFQCTAKTIFIPKACKPYSHVLIDNI